MMEAHTVGQVGGAVGCTDAMAILWDYLDGELSPAREAAMRAHLAACASCFRRHEFERAFLDAVATARTSDPAPFALRSRVTNLLRAQGLLP